MNEEEKKHENPFWKEQEEIFAGADNPKREAFALKLFRAENRWRCFRNGWGNPKKWIRRQEEYEALIREGKAERFGEMPFYTYDDCVEWVETCRRAESNGQFGLRAVVMYNEEWKFLRRVMVYKIFDPKMPTERIK